MELKFRFLRGIVSSCTVRVAVRVAELASFWLLCCLSRRSFPAKEPPIIGLFCGKWCVAVCVAELASFWLLCCSVCSMQISKWASLEFVGHGGGHGGIVHVYSALQRVAEGCSVWCCSVLRCGLRRCSLHWQRLQHTATHCNTLHATHCDTLRHTATHCDAL